MFSSGYFSAKWLVSCAELASSVVFANNPSLLIKHPSEKERKEEVTILRSPLLLCNVVRIAGHAVLPRPYPLQFRVCPTENRRAWHAFIFLKTTNVLSITIPTDQRYAMILRLILKCAEPAEKKL